MNGGEKLNQRFQQGASLPPWRTGRGHFRDLNQGFVEFIRVGLEGIQPDRNMMRGDAVAYIQNQERGGDLSVLEARWEDYQEHLKAAATQSEPIPVFNPDDPKYDANTPEARAARAKIRAMLKEQGLCD